MFLFEFLLFSEFVLLLLESVFLGLCYLTVFALHYSVFAPHHQQLIEKNPSDSPKFKLIPPVLCFGGSK